MRLPPKSEFKIFKFSTKATGSNYRAGKKTQSVNSIPKAVGQTMEIP
jgi:hypothetical protein